MQQTCVAVIEDNKGVRQLIGDILEREGSRALLAANADEGLALVGSETVDAVFVDLRLPGRGGMSLIDELRRLRPTVPTVVMTGYASLESSLEALRLGVADYIMKPITAEKISTALARAMADSIRTPVTSAAPNRGTKPVDATEQTAAELPFVASDPAMQPVLKLVDRAAQCSVPVLVQGETGVGKERLARKIHQQSSRASGPLMRANCAALRSDDLERAFFGLGSGDENNPQQAGLFEKAEGGSLFLQHVEQLPLWMQGRLAETLQQGWFRRLGGQRTIPCDVRLIASTIRDLASDARQGIFHEALYYCLDVLRINVPPLRLRPADLRTLVEQALTEYCRLPSGQVNRKPLRISKGAWDCLLDYKWPGNIRELHNAIRRATVLAEHREIGELELSELRRPTAEHDTSDTIEIHLKGGLKSIEQQVITEVIHRHHGNKAAAARTLGLHRKTLYRLLQEDLSSNGKNPSAADDQPKVIQTLQWPSSSAMNQPSPSS